MSDRLDTLIDHAAALQAEVNRLSQEVTLLAVAAVSFGVALMLLSWKLWQAE